MAMLQAAEFRALPAIDARPFGSQHKLFLRPGMRSCLPARLGTQKRMDDIGRFEQLDGNIRTEGIWNFVRRLEACAGICLDIEIATTIAVRLTVIVMSAGSWLSADAGAYRN
jgi:hypothetical protein